MTGLYHDLQGASGWEEGSEKASSLLQSYNSDHSALPAVVANTWLVVDIHV